MRTVLCFGTFDGLHPGHQAYFEQARAHGNRLIVVVALDQTVLAVKGKLPHLSEDDRRQAVSDHPLVDEAYLGMRGDKYQIIERLRPDVIMLGYDQLAFTDRLQTELRSRGLEPLILRADPYQPEIYKTSLLRSHATI